MITWRSAERREGIKIVSDDGAWTILTNPPLTLEWNLYHTEYSQNTIIPDNVGYPTFRSQHNRLEQAMQAAEDADETKP